MVCNRRRRQTARPRCSTGRDFTARQAQTDFRPHVDCGDHVIVINCAKAILTGGKLHKKYYYRHTGYIGHLKAVRYDTLMKEDPEKAMRLAVKGMIPDSTIGRQALTRLRLFAGAEHKHAAQQPAEWAV